MGIRSVLLLFVFYCFSVDGQVSDPLPTDFLLIADSMAGALYRTDKTNYSYVTIPRADNFSPEDIDYDPIDAVIFAANRFDIISLSIYGERQTTVRAFNPEANIIGIAVDAASRLLFYTDMGNHVIGVISLATGSHKTVFRNVERPGDIVVDPLNGNIYWSERGPSQITLWMSSYDGTNRTQVEHIIIEVSSFVDANPMSDLDFKDGDLYLCLSEHSRIRRVNANGSNGQIIYDNEEEELGCSITMDQSNIYVIFGREIKRLRMDGTGETTISSDEMTYPAVIHSHSNKSQATNGCSSGRGSCSHFCFPLPGGSRMCSCPDFMTLQPDHQTCEGSSIILITTNDRSSIYAIDSSTGYSNEITLENIDKPHAVSYDPIKETIFWTDTTLHMISSATVSGRNERMIRYLKVNSSPHGIAVDATSRLLFYTDKENGIIAVLSLDGSSHKVILRNKFEEPGAIVTNPVNGTIFWTSFGNNGKIETANYDGTNKRAIINTGDVEPSGLAIDLTEGVLYWCIASGIYKADINGANRQIIFKENKITFQRIAFCESNLYFTSPSHRNVMKRGSDGGKPKPFGPTTSGNIVDIHVFKGPDTKDKNGCSNASDTCSHFCFPRPGGLKMCACPDDMSLQSDGRTCQTSVTSLPTDYTMNTQSVRPLTSHDMDGSVRLNVIQAAVGSLACLLAISVLFNVCLFRKIKRIRTEDRKSELCATLVSREEEGGQNRRVSETVNNDSL
ncbi:hypothetical protein ACJMK2_022717 [Sinanodonta woodiana]|uniref:EGF-like domain-containing protein n=1 Tax=Sinanodonta woodiana TaxID=1069815 RepID=A0ABD3TLN9_SINWO